MAGVNFDPPEVKPFYSVPAHELPGLRLEQHDDSDPCPLLRPESLDSGNALPKFSLPHESLAGSQSIGASLKSPKNLFPQFIEHMQGLGERVEDDEPIQLSTGAIPRSARNTSPAGPGPLKKMAQALHQVYAGFASLFDSTPEEVGRTLLLGAQVVSAGLRAFFPIIRDLVLSIQATSLGFVLTVTAFVLAACHLAISSICMLVSTRDVHATVSNIGKRISEGLAQIGNELDALKKKGMIGVIAATREWLLTSNAVIGFISILPSLVKTVGTVISAPVAAIASGSISLVTSALEVFQGINEYCLLRDELKKLNAEKTLRPGTADSDRIAKLILAKTRELGASKLRIAKGVIGIITSIATIALGTLTLVASITVPHLPVIITFVSLASVVVYLMVALFSRKMRIQEESSMSPRTNTASDENPTAAAVIATSGVQEPLQGRHVPLQAQDQKPASPRATQLPSKKVREHARPVPARQDSGKGVAGVLDQESAIQGETA